MQYLKALVSPLAVEVTILQYYKKLKKQKGNMK